MKNFEEEYNVFQDALEIPKPWYVFHNELAKEEKHLTHLY
jgi:transposase